MPNSYDDIIFAQNGIQELIKHYCSQPKIENASNSLKEYSLDSTTSSTQEKSIPLNAEIDSFMVSINKIMELRGVLLDLKQKQYTSHLQDISSNLLSSSENNERNTLCQETTQHLQKIIENQSIIVWYLQQPVVTSYLSMHHSYHDDLGNLIKSVVDVLHHFESHNHILNSDGQPTTKVFEQNIVELTKSLEAIKKNLKNINDLRVKTTNVLEEEK